MSEKRIAVTLPAGPRISDTVDRIRWAEENEFPTRGLATLVLLTR
jgi:hypothetical protein